MAWAKIDDQFPEHEKVSGLSDRAFRLHVAALCYCARNLTDGALTAKAVKVVAAVIDMTRPARYVTELVNAGLWVCDGDDHRIHDYAEFNPTADEVREQRRQATERQRRWRESHRATNGRFTQVDASHNASRDTSRDALVDAAPSPPLTPSSKEDTPLQHATPWEGKLSQETGREMLLVRLTAAIGGGEQNRRKIDNALRRYTISEADLAQTIEAVTSPTARDKVALALSELTKRRHPRAAA